MLTKMRKPVAKALAFILFPLLILSFAIWGIGDIFRATGGGNSVAEVGSVSVEAEEYNRALRQEFQRLQQSFGGQVDFADLRAMGVPEQVLQRLVGRALFDDEARELGLIVTDEQVRQIIASEPAFQDELGNFDRERFVTTLRRLGLSEAGYVATLKRDIQRQQIGDAITAGLATPPATLSEVLFAYAQELRTAEGLLVERASFQELPEPDEAALREIYEARSSQFMTPELKQAVVLPVRVEDLAETITITDDELAQAYETRKEELAVPELRDIDQILLPSEEEAQAASERLSEGVAFDALSQELTASDPIEIGEVSRAELEQQFPALAEAAFGAEEGAFTEPVQTAFGWHILRVKAVEPAHQPSLEEVGEELREELAEERAVEQMVDFANQIDDRLAGGESLEQTAEALGLDLIEVPAIDAEGRDAEGMPIEGLPRGQAFLDVLARATPGQPSLLTETELGNYFVLRVESVTPPAPEPFEEVRDEVVEIWQRQERERLARERAEELLARAEEGVTLAKVAEDEGMDLLVRGPVNRFGQGRAGVTVSGDLAARLFEMEQGEVGLAETPDGVMVLRLVDIDRPDPASEPEALASLGEEVASALRNDILVGFANALRAETDVSVNRSLAEDLAARY